jgi:hypothetical protein
MDRKQKLKEPDTRTINIDDDYALEFWVRELNVSQKKLIAAVRQAGTAAIDVKRELNK